MIFQKSLFRELCRTSRTGRTIAEDWLWREITGIFTWHFSLRFGFRTIEEREPFEQRGFSIVIQQSDLDHAVFRGIVKSDLQKGPLQLLRFGDAPAEIQQSELKITGQMT